MKTTAALFVLVFLLIPLQNVAAEAGPADREIRLTADQIDSADDIEAAIISATGRGTRPGTVILDGSNGAFVFTGEDKSLNIFVSNLVLQGENQAVIENCDDGLFFDDFQLKHILVQDIAFFCTGDGVEGGGTFEGVILRDNIFYAGLNGISLGGASSEWLITGNVIEAGRDGIGITGASAVNITNNHISGSTGILLLQCSNARVTNNTIQALYQGMLLGQESWGNGAQANTILGVSYSGIGLEPGVTNNRILANKVYCAPAVECLTVDALPEVFETNRIAGNR